MDSLSIETLMKSAAELIIKSNYVVVFTGAGISTPSGIPDFRSPDSGLWNHSDPLEVASIWSFRQHPENFYNWIRPLSIKAESAMPNAAHLAISELEKRGIVKAVITQNIDGLHQKAGAKKVLELHGSARTATCQKCGKKYKSENLYKLFVEDSNLPYCINCRGIIKPDIVLYGEILPQVTWASAYNECLRADLMIIAGSSLEVTPANTLPETAIQNMAKLIINNLSPTHLDSRADLVIKTDVVDGIGRITEFL